MPGKTLPSAAEKVGLAMSIEHFPKEKVYALTVTDPMTEETLYQTTGPSTGAVRQRYLRWIKSTYPEHDIHTESPEPEPERPAPERGKPKSGRVKSARTMASEVAQAATQAAEKAVSLRAQAEELEMDAKRLWAALEVLTEGQHHEEL